MLRYVLLLVLIVLIARAVWRVIDGVAEGLRGPGHGSRRSSAAVSMQRDPICGTFVVPDRAVTLAIGRQQLYFCSTACRDKYRARTA
jgi:YHS domain-containing protein